MKGTRRQRSLWPGEREASEEAQDAEAPENGPDAEDELTATGPPVTFHTAIQGGTVKTVLTTLRAIVDEARIHIDEDGISVRAVDRATIAMDGLELTAGVFATYDTYQRLNQAFNNCTTVEAVLQ